MFSNHTRESIDLPVSSAALEGEGVPAGVALQFLQVLPCPDRGLELTLGLAWLLCVQALEESLWENFPWGFLAGSQE